MQQVGPAPCRGTGRDRWGQAGSPPAGTAAQEGLQLVPKSCCSRCMPAGRCCRLDCDAHILRRPAAEKLPGWVRGSGRPQTTAGTNPNSQQSSSRGSTHLCLVLEGLSLGGGSGGADGAALLAGRLAAEQAGGGGGTGGARRCGRWQAGQRAQRRGSSAGGMAGGAGLLAGWAACEGSSGPPQGAIAGASQSPAHHAYN